jgi:phosphatidylserine/phosphatidylglycerophosphate/cardiolipin synthase-like enzyme
VQLWAGEGAFFSRLSRAMEQARRAVWLTCSFFHREWRLPDGSLWWDALQRAADRGLDVRVLFWRNPAFFSGQNIFQGTPEDLAFLRARGATFRARWDSSGSDEHHCHHQKLWLIDPDQDDGIAFVGGMVKTRLDTPARVAAGHPEGRHDATLELRGPAVVDVVHGFVQRWNEAAPDPSSPPPWPDAQAAGPLPWPSSLPPACGATEVQVLRTVRPGIYHRHPPPPGASPFSIERGEASIWRAYLDEIDRAQETIYLENQHPGELRVLEALERALGRGVRVLFVVPGQPMAAITREKARALQDPQARYRTTFETLARLGAHPYFCLASLAHSFSPAVESREEIYVHAKTCVIDGAWMTCGSANLVDLSLWPDHTELNVASWGQREASAALESLLGAHLGGARGTHRHLVEAGIEAARRNAALRARGKPWNGTLMALDAARYADP